jgi:hypothetical protein
LTKMIMEDLHKYADFELKCPFPKVWWIFKSKKNV